MQLLFDNVEFSYPKRSSFLSTPKNDYRSIAFKGFKKAVLKDTVSLGEGLYDSAMSKLNKFTKAEYELLTEAEKNVLRGFIDNPESTLLNSTVKKDVNYHHFATEAIRQVFDKQYGEGNYVVITLGRSLSSISKLLEMKLGAENVKNIPMSNLSRYWSKGDSLNSYNINVNRFVSDVGFPDFKKYLSSVGLTRETVENSGKNYIIMDYTSSGQSLESGYMLLTSEQLLGNSKRNITFASMFDVANATNKRVETSILLDYYLEASMFKRYSTVGKLNELSKIETVSDFDQIGKVPQVSQCKKLFGFALLDSMYSGKKLPYSEKFDIDTSSVEYKKIWKTFKEQFSQDFLEDSFGLFKAVNKSGDENDVLNFDFLFNKLFTLCFRSQEPFGVRMSNYYELYRPKIFEFINSKQN